MGVAFTVFHFVQQTQEKKRQALIAKARAQAQVKYARNNNLDTSSESAPPARMVVSYSRRMLNRLKPPPSETKKQMGASQATDKPERFGKECDPHICILFVCVSAYFPDRLQSHDTLGRGFVHPLLLIAKMKPNSNVPVSVQKQCCC